MPSVLWVYRFRWQKDTTNRRAKGQRAGDKLRTQLFLIIFKQQRIDLIDVIDFVFQTMKNQKKKSFSLRVFLCLLAVLLAVYVAFGVYVSDYYHADPAAEDALVSDDVVSVTKQNGNWVFAPESPTAGRIFYPGGNVENTAYAPLLHDLAEDGILCVLVKMPCNLAVLDMNAADSIPERFSEVTDWYIGGHSLGGAMAASYAAKHTDELDGLVLLAAYSTADLTDSGLRVYAAYGSEDGVLNRETYEADRVNLPQDTTETVIDGGCHAGFGSYGAQKGDGAPVISAEEQQQQTADALAAWMNLQ